MPQVIKVFSESEALELRGSNASEMLVCPQCKKQFGTFVNQSGCMPMEDENQDGVLFSEIFWERWSCFSCGNFWIERYAVGDVVNRVIKEDKGIFDREPPDSGVDNVEHLR